MELKKMTVTPELAKRLMTYNTNNRKLKPAAVKEYAYKMQNGMWNGNVLDPIVVTKDGVLENGQHRLEAVIKSGVAVQMYVATDAESAAGAYDVGVPRSIRDALMIRGIIRNELRHTTIQAVISYIFETLGLPRKEPVLVEKYCGKYGDILYDATTASGQGTTNAISKKAGVMTGAYMALRCGVDYGELERFFRAVNTGFSDRPQDSCAILLRNYILTADQINIATVGVRGRRKNLHIYTECAIADYVAGKSRRRAYTLDEDKMPYRARVLQEDAEYMKGVNE